MSYEQTLVKELKDVVNPKILKKQNRYKKWEYGYNIEYDFIVISKTGKIGRSLKYKISGLLYQQSMNRINEAIQKRNNAGNSLSIQKNYKELKPGLTGKNIL